MYCTLESSVADPVQFFFESRILLRYVFDAEQKKYFVKNYFDERRLGFWNYTSTV